MNYANTNTKNLTIKYTVILGTLFKELFFEKKQKLKNLSTCIKNGLKWTNSNCYINTNEIPRELSCENLICSHVKIACYLHMRQYHRFYGYIINPAFHTKKLLRDGPLEK